MHIPLKNEPLVLSQLAAGCEEAFNAIYNHYSSTIYNAVMSYVKDEHQADELLQVIFMQVWEKRAKLAEVESLENYLFIMARNIVLNHLKKKAREGVLHVQYLQQPVSATGNAETQLNEKQYREYWLQAMECLSPQQQRAYLLATDAGLSYDEIAAQMSISKLTVKKHLELARRHVRDYMNRRLHPFVMLPLLYFQVAALAGV